MFCYRCGKEFDSAFCPDCGAPANPQVQADVSAAARTNKNRKIWITVIVCIVLIPMLLPFIMMSVSYIRIMRTMEASRREMAAAAESRSIAWALTEESRSVSRSVTDESRSISRSLTDESRSVSRSLTDESRSVSQSLTDESRSISRAQSEASREQAAKTTTARSVTTTKAVATGTTKKPEPPKPAPTAADGTIEDFAELAKEEANSLYIGKVIELKGSAYYFSTISGTHIELRDRNRERLDCYFSDTDEIAKVAELYKDSQVIITGKYVANGSYGAKLQDCKVRLANGKKIELTKVPPSKNGVCELTIEAFKDLDLKRNGIREYVFFKGVKIKVTAKVVGKFRTYHSIINDSYYIKIGSGEHTIVCRTESYSKYESLNEGDTVTVVGDCGEPAFSYYSCDIFNSNFTKH